MQNYRITPAYAGKRPHYAPLYSVMQGSPPPMRGKVSKENVPVLINGITPAYAGKSVKLLAPWSGFQDHPRLCGEKYVRSGEHGITVRSPPPMRGKAKLAVESSACCRITPAYAGKRIPYFAACFTISDHPRLCGEKENPADCSVKM